MLKFCWFVVFLAFCLTSFTDCASHEAFRAYENLQMEFDENASFNEIHRNHPRAPKQKSGIVMKKMIASILKQFNDSINEMSWEKYFENVYPGKIPGPQSRKDRIAVVGAGSAGVHMAYLLKRKGFTNITILEQSKRIGNFRLLLIYINHVLLGSKRKLKSNYYRKLLK